uniref:Transmembrane protein 231 n=1 Tax=Panagrellus redivivus TaxID=6233 RepID=A0A7E4W9K1_PANRE
MGWRLLFLLASVLLVKIYLTHFSNRDESEYCGFIFNTCKYRVKTTGPMNIFAPAEVNLTYPTDNFTFSVIAYHPFVFTDALLCYEAQSDIRTKNITKLCHETVLPRNGLGSTTYTWQNSGDITRRNKTVIETMQLKVVKNTTKIRVLHVPRGVFIRFPEMTKISFYGYPSRFSIDLAKFAVFVLFIGMFMLYAPTFLQLFNQIRAKSQFRYQLFTNRDSRGARGFSAQVV